MINRKRPPLGVMPYWIWKEHFPNPSEREKAMRVITLSQAISRYVAEGVPHSAKWDAEFMMLISQTDPEYKFFLN